MFHTYLSAAEEHTSLLQIGMKHATELVLGVYDNIFQPKLVRSWRRKISVTVTGHVYTCHLPKHISHCHWPHLLEYDWGYKVYWWRSKVGLHNPRVIGMGVLNILGTGLSKCGSANFFIFYFLRARARVCVCVCVCVCV